MGIEYFLQRPLTGWGDISWMYSLNDAQFRDFASKATILAPVHGFHNEFITNSVRSGIWGLLSSLILYMLVFYKAIVGIRGKISNDHRFVSLCILVIILHLFFASMTTETTNLTFLSSFIGITLSLFMSQQHIEEAKLRT
jgi:O-antigen ligase